MLLEEDTDTTVDLEMRRDRVGTWPCWTKTISG